ncbi:RNase H domain-containing protein [Raphanus sativus]|nr:RNase H domain-containing protein [Raphanus sativus]
MFLTLGTPSRFTRKILLPKGEDFVQLRRLRFSSGCAPERSMAPVRNLSSNIATTGSSPKVKGSNSKSLVPESPNLFSPELPGLTQPPEPPDPLDAPPETQDVPSLCQTCNFRLLLSPSQLDRFS